ncbi:hypothetical protein [Pedobacter heparinus]|uniref:hypothetical protein n=1 Tax=Pedobacter heparinus TaxID=984 RepID=UPI002930302F|nr:hypothetical protein [Pedobacter heparinus]
MFKKTTRTTHKESQSSSKQTEANMLILKNTNKETQIYTYWTDSGFYQFKYIKEQVALNKTGQLKSLAKANEETKIATKQTEQVKLWIYFGVAVAVFGLYLVYRKLYSWLS